MAITHSTNGAGVAYLMDDIDARANLVEAEAAADGITRIARRMQLAKALGEFEFLASDRE